MHKIFCFTVGGANLTSEMRTFLFRTACSMYRENKGRVRVVTDDLEGVVETQSKTAGFGAIFGILFHAELDTVYGKATVDYIVRTRDIEDFDPEDLQWLYLTMVPMSSAPPGARNAQWN